MSGATRIVREGPGKTLFCAGCERTVGDLAPRCPKPDPWDRGLEYTFIFSNVVPFPAPVPWSGRQAIWRVDPAGAPPAQWAGARRRPCPDRP